MDFFAFISLLLYKSNHLLAHVWKVPHFENQICLLYFWEWNDKINTTIMWSWGSNLATYLNLHYAHKIIKFLKTKVPKKHRLFHKIIYSNTTISLKGHITGLFITMHLLPMAANIKLWHTTEWSPQPHLPTWITLIQVNNPSHPLPSGL